MRAALPVQRGRARHDDEEADDAGEHGAGDHVDPLEREVLGAQLLVDGVGLDEREPPRGQRGADGGGDDRDRLPVTGHARHQQAVHRRAPVGVGQHTGDDVGQEHRRQQQQDVLDPVEAAPQHQQRDDHRGDRAR